MTGFVSLYETFSVILKSSNHNYSFFITALDKEKDIIKKRASTDAILSCVGTAQNSVSFIAQFSMHRSKQELGQALCLRYLHGNQQV